MTIEGIDVSKWQTTTPALDGLDFLFARSSIGTRKDERYDMHIANARKAGLLVGAYHFNWSALPVDDQVRAFLAAAGDVDFYVIDVERDNSADMPAFTLAQTKEFIRLVKAEGKLCGLYHSDAGFLSAGQDYNWVAKWSVNSPARAWKFWQYQGSPLDRNRFNGTIAQLRTLAGSVTEVEDPPMRNFKFIYDTDGRPVTAKLTFPDPLAKVLILGTDQLSGVSTAWVKQGVKAKLLAPITEGKPNTDDWTLGWVIGDNAAFALDRNVTKERYPNYTKADLDAMFTDGRVSGFAEGRAEGIAYQASMPDLTPLDQVTFDIAVAAAREEGEASGAEQGVASEQARIKGVLGL